MLTRRSLLKQSAFLSLAPVVPGFVARTALAAKPEGDGRVLVVVQLDGGNDGINTVVPFGDEGYAKHRKELRLPTDSLCKLTKSVGLHPAMRKAADMVEDGRMGIVQGVGYPNPDRSHFTSMAVWHSARLGKDAPDSRGWLGRALDVAGPSANGPWAVHVGEQSLPPPSSPGGPRPRRSPTPPTSPCPSTALPSPRTDLDAFVGRTVTSAYTTAALEESAGRKGDASTRYPETKLANQLGLVARSIKAGASVRVYYVIQPGYDTHSIQLPVQGQLLGEFAGAARAFLDDLKAAKLAERVTLMAFSEFGRRPAENGSFGTDHGTAGPLFLAGPTVQAGLLGKTPRLDDLEDGDLRWSTDFRDVYAALLDQWLKLPASEILGKEFKAAPVFRNLV